MKKFERLKNVNDNVYSKARVNLYESANKISKYEKLRNDAIKEKNMNATPLRWDGDIVRPIRQSFLTPQMYKNVAVTFVEDSGAVLYFLESDFTCIVMHKSFEDICEFIDTVKGNINYDEDDDNGNINAVVNAWYERGVVQW